jgi:hypothetical protein
MQVKRATKDRMTSLAAEHPAPRTHYQLPTERQGGILLRAPGLVSRALAVAIASVPHSHFWAMV